ncbi:MAG TPA: potassium/proton antiporter, partial [Alphaproteobacteria bacterium]|nr:potassium/proton antiporter [Alphaproteobacteria bacterium]
IRRFQAGMTWLAQIVMFVTLGLLATPSQFGAVALPALALSVLLILVARPLAIWLCLWPFRFSHNEMAFVAWVGLRGAVSILLAIVPILGGVAEGQALFNTAFLVVVVSLVVQGWTIAPVARWLRLTVPATMGPVERVELDLPGQATYELVTYTVVEQSPVTRGATLPRWARPSLIVRDGRPLPLYRIRELRAGDRVYLFAPPRRVPLLDRLYAGTAPLSAEDEAFFGDFVLKPDVALGELAGLYGIAIGAEPPALTLAELFHREFGAALEVGDRLRIGQVELIARDVAEGAVEAVGLAVEPTPPVPQLPLFQKPHEIAAAIRARWAARRARRQAAE